MPPVKLKPLRGRVPRYNHHQRHLRDDDAAGYGSGGGGGRGGGGGGGNNDLPNRPEFNTRDAPLEAKHRVNRIRDRATRLDSQWSVTPSGLGERAGMMEGPAAARGVGGVANGGMLASEQEPILYGEWRWHVVNVRC